MGRLVGIDSPYARAANDWYVEPRWVVDALLDVESFPCVPWDPACGGGNIPKALQARGLACRGSDIADRGYGDRGHDFFDARECVDCIVSNPPYAVIERFIAHALTLTTRKVAILARLTLLESIKRQAMFRSTPLARVLVSSRRVSMPPGDQPGIEPRGGAFAYAWFVWEHGHQGDPRIGWV